MRRKRLFAWLVVIGLVLYWASSTRPVMRYFYPLHYRASIQEYSQAYHLDQYLIFAVVRAESGFDPAARSRTGAVGLMQLMPDTARWVAETAGIHLSNAQQIENPTTNIQLGCWYLADLRDEFEQNWIIALAAYNAGRGNVRKWLVSGIWDGTENGVSRIPFPETREYVVRVMNDYRAYHRLYYPN